MNEDSTPIILGDQVKDSVTNFQGTYTKKHETYLGPVESFIQAPSRDGKKPEGLWVFEPQLVRA